MLDENELNELEENAGLQFSYEECAIILGVDIEKFLRQITNKKSFEYIAYERGRLVASAEIRKAIQTQAKNGSSPAQKQMLDLISAAQIQNSTRNNAFHQNLYTFSDINQAIEVYETKNVKGLFVKVGNFIDEDGEQRIKVAMIEKIKGTIKTSKKVIDVYKEDIRTIYPQGN